MVSVELDDEFLNLFYDITNTNRPRNVDLMELKQQLIRIVDTLKELNDSAKKPVQSKALGNYVEEAVNDDSPAILVVDDLGVITYQLKVLLSEFDMDVDCSQEIYDAVNKFSSRKYKYVVMDLFIPTEREGFILLTELKKIITASNLDTIIGVITVSQKKETERQCLARGASFFLEKSNDWQNELRNTIAGYINAEAPNDDF
ncbi:response regulator [bacterium]|nr:response regulator [bacterium]